MKNKPYDTLNAKELGIARMPETMEEKASLVFKLATPREYGFGMRHIHYYWRRYASSQLELTQTRKFSEATTNYSAGLRLVHLAHLIKTRKPKIVYEFGTGVSTVLIAELIKEYGGKIVSFEQSESHYESIQKHFPNSLRETTDLRLAKVNLDWFGSYRGIYYDFEPPPEVDLVYIDGATRTRGNEESNFVYRRLNADLVKMHLAGTKIGYAVTDHRWANYPFYKDLLSGYKIKCSRWWKGIIIDPID